MLCAFVSATLAISMEPSSDTLASRSTSLDRNDSDLIFANARTHQYRGAPRSNNNAITVIVKQIKVCDLVGEVNPPLNAFISCDEGIIDKIVFASYGTPTGSCETGFAIGTCNSASSLDIVKQMCVGKNSCTVSASNSVFGDPCYGTLKRLGILATCSTKVTNVMFAVAAADRVAGKAAVQATFSFTPSAGGASPISVTLNYPPGFFSPSATPTATSSSVDTVLTPETPGVTSIVLSVTGTALSAATAVTVTLAGCTLGPARAAGDVTVQTSADPIPSNAVASGVIGGAVTSVSFGIAADEHVAGRTNVAATFSFTPSAGGASPISVTLNYPPGFFSPSATPNATSSSVDTILTPETPGVTSIVLSVTGTALSAATAVTVTLAGCTLGPARVAGGVTVQTSADPIPSNAVASGVIGGAVTSISFGIAAADRVANRTNVAATFAFTPSAGGASPISVTLNYPPGFFSPSATPNATSSSVDTILSPETPGVTSIVLSVTGTALSAATAVTVTLAGCTLGPARAAGDVTVQTSADPIPSNAVTSGMIYDTTPFTTTELPFTSAPSPLPTPPPTSCDCGACGCCSGCFFSRANNSCVVCPAGTVSSICQKNLSCEECPAGSYCPDSHMSSPLPCPAGSFAESGAVSCTPCASASGADAVQCTQQRLSSLALGIIIAVCAIVNLISALVMFRRVVKDSNSRHNRVLWAILAVAIGPLVWCVWYCKQRGRGKSAFREVLLADAGDSSVSMHTAHPSFTTPFAVLPDTGTTTKILNPLAGVPVARLENFAVIHGRDLTRDVSVSSQRGSFREVSKCMWKGTPVAVKQIMNVADVTKFMQEARMMHSISHPNCVRMYGVCAPPDAAIVMEWMGGGDLLQFLARRPLPKLQRRLSLFRQICAGLNSLHSHSPDPIIHADLKPANILLDSDEKIAKIAESGLSKIKTASYAGSTAAGTLLYFAPEMLLKSALSYRPTDIYAMGLIFWEMLTGKPVWHNPDGSPFQPSQLAAKYIGTERPSLDELPPGLIQL
jgi:hypothetical protein